VRLCPRHHVNGRRAEACAECGSRELTQAAPRPHFSDRLIEWSCSLLPVALVVIVPSVVMLMVVRTVAASAQLQSQVVGLLVLLALTYWVWQQLPGVVRSGLKGAGRWAARGRARRDRH
jgi:hypothetical protein